MAEAKSLGIPQSHPTELVLVPGYESRAHSDTHMNAFEEWRAALDAAGELTPDLVDRIVAVHGDRGRRAIEAVGERRVKEYRDFTVVVGHSEEYIVEDGRCVCKDAQYNLDRDDPIQRCWHELAVIIARSTGAVDHHDLWYSEVGDLL